MKRIMITKNFIIYMLLVILVITGAGMGLDKDCQVFSSYYNVQESKISAPVITISNDLHTFQVSERTPVIISLRSLNGSRSRTFARLSLLFLSLLAILSVFLRLIQEVFVLYERLYIEKRYCMIAFIHDMDGRKRIS